MVMGYCLKCREKREMVNVTEEEVKGGRASYRGNCKRCGGGMFKLRMKDRTIPEPS